LTMCNTLSRRYAHIATEIAAEIATGIAMGIAVEIATGIAMGIAAEIATGIAMGIAAEIATGIAMGIAAEIATGIAPQPSIRPVPVSPWPQERQFRVQQQRGLQPPSVHGMVLPSAAPTSSSTDRGAGLAAAAARSGRDGTAAGPSAASTSSSTGQGAVLAAAAAQSRGGRGGRGGRAGRAGR
jgi:hypothetical protein